MKRFLLIVAALIAIAVIYATTAVTTAPGNNVIDNGDVIVEYVKRDNGEYEVYVTVKDGVVSEAVVSDDGTSVLIAPDR